MSSNRSPPLTSGANDLVAEFKKSKKADRRKSTKGTVNETKSIA